MSIFSFIKSHAVLASTVGVVVVAGAIISGRVASRAKNAPVSESNTKHVALVAASDFRTDSNIVSADGVIQSLAQVDIKSQIAAPISYLAVELGDQVAAGQIIAELSNADIRAQLEQAKLSLSAEGVSLTSARKTAIDAVDDSYLAADEAIHTNVDPMIFNSTKTSVQLSAFATNPIDYQNNVLTVRQDLTNIFIEWKRIADKLDVGATDAEITSALKTSEKNIEKVRTLLDTIAGILNQGAIISVPSDLPTVNAWKATITATRGSISGVGTSLVAADRTFSNTVVTQGGQGVAPSTVAQANVRNLEAQLAKTVLRAPVGGKISALPLRTGELATTGTLIATIVGPGGLQVDAFASADDIAKISRGSKALISGTTTGSVDSISPSVNPLNKKVEVKILVTDPKAAATLVIGQNVNIRIEANKAVSSDASSTSGGLYRVPIQDVKIVPGSAYVFTIDDSSKLVRHDITLGEVKGDFIEVRGGLSPDMKIVSPVYELEEGQEVIAN